MARAFPANAACFVRRYPFVFGGVGADEKRAVGRRVEFAGDEQGFLEEGLNIIDVCRFYKGEAVVLLEHLLRSALAVVRAFLSLDRVRSCLLARPARTSLGRMFD